MAVAVGSINIGPSRQSQLLQLISSMYKQFYSSGLPCTQSITDNILNYMMYST